jgi:hypothetical protein
MGFLKYHQKYADYTCLFKNTLLNIYYILYIYQMSELKSYLDTFFPTCTNETFLDCFILD